MKKSIFSLMLGAIVALTSCSKSDEQPTVPQEGDQLATFKVEAPALTRAGVSDLTRYIVEAYEGKDLGVAPVRAEAASGALEISLKKNTDYIFLFWADKGTAGANTGYWDAAKLQEVKVAAGKESTVGQAAYCFVLELNSKDLTPGYPVTLKNATAQVNFVETSGLTTTGNKLVVTYAKGVTLNVGTGKVTDVTGEVVHTFTGISQVAQDEKLATDYVLSPLGEQNVVNLKMQFNTETEKVLSNVPFQQNYKTNIKGEYTNMYASVFTISNEVEDYTNKPDVEFPVKFKVGDYYPDLNVTFNSDKTVRTGIAPIGVVFWVDETDPSYNSTDKTSAKGKIVSLDEGEGRWGVSAKDESADVEGILSQDDGATATKNLITARKSSATFATDYAAFNWIYATKNRGNINGRWYMPTYNELFALHAVWNGSSSKTADEAARAAFNTKLTSANGVVFSTTVNYWSSVEVIANTVIRVSFDQGLSGSDSKNAQNKVRAVLAF